MTDFFADDETTNQLLQLGYNGQAGARSHSNPLLICDVDEVVLHLVDPFVTVLQERGFELKTHSFKLTGNVYHATTGEEASQDEVSDALTQLFEEQQHRQSIVDGVVEGLNTLSRNVDIVFLTNMPHAFRDTRRAHLLDQGLDFPLITNTRSKVPAIQVLKDHCNRSVGFIDDTPKNLDQVRQRVEGVHLFHFMANEQFRDMAGAIDGVHFSSGDWAHASEKIHHALMENT